MIVHGCAWLGMPELYFESEVFLFFLPSFSPSPFFCPPPSLHLILSPSLYSSRWPGRYRLQELSHPRLFASALQPTEGLAIYLFVSSFASDFKEHNVIVRAECFCFCLSVATYN